MELQWGKARHMQLSVDAARWPDGPLKGILTHKGKPLSGLEVRQALREMKQQGFEVVPCGCPGSEKPPGKCPGIKKED